MEEKTNKGKVLIAFIGAGNARATQYAPFESQVNGEGYILKKKSSKEYILKQYNYPFLAKLTEEVFDQIVFIGTNGSRWGMLKENLRKILNSKQPELEIDEEKFFPEYLVEQKIDDFKKELSDYLSQYISSVKNITYDIKVEIILIKEGRTELENKENIKKIQDSLSRLDILEITLDVTNGLRSHPMYVLPIISNLAAIYNKNIPINIYYGMYDAKVKETDSDLGIYKPTLDQNGMVIAPMVDLKEIQIMDKWSEAIREFFSNGSVLHILELLEKGEHYFTKDVDNRTYNIWYIDALNTFSFAVNSNNLDMFQEAITKIHQLINQQNMLVGISKEMPIYMQNSLEQVIFYIKQQFDWKDGEESKKYSSYMFSLANWYLKQDRLGDSVRTFQEAVITYVMEAYPDKIFNLLESRVIKWKKEKDKTKEECVKDKLFDANIRKVIRKAIYEDETVINNKDKEWGKWKEWKKEYDYMRDYVHNPDALLYNGSLLKNEKMTDIKEAKDNIIKFSKKMEEERENKNFNGITKSMLECRIDYLNEIKYYDVFISYRRSYHNERLNDGVLLMTSISDYLKAKGLNVFSDKNEMAGKEGAFTQHLHNSLVNSKICLIILGKDAYKRDYSDKDEYYKEIITAVQKDIRTAIVCMKDFYSDDNLIAYGKGVEEQKELMTVINERQRIGSEFSDIWEYENILSLRECIYKEIDKMLNE